MLFFFFFCRGDFYIRCLLIQRRIINKWNIVLFGLFLSNFSFKVFKMLLGRGFHTLVNNVSFSSRTDVGSHSLPLQGPQCSAGTRFLPSIWDLTIHSPSRPSVTIALLMAADLRLCGTHFPSTSELSQFVLASPTAKINARASGLGFKRRF